MSHEISQADLEAYLDEALPPEEMAAIEEAMRNDDAVREKLAMIHGRRDAGIHTLGEIWRRYRLTCPSREQLVLFLDERLSDEESAYVSFHLEQIHCRLCVASFEDISISRQDEDEATVSRRQRLLDRSSTYLKKTE